MPDILAFLLAEDADLHRIVDHATRVGGAHAFHLSERIGVIQGHHDLAGTYTFLEHLQSIRVMHQSVEV